MPINTYRDFVICVEIGRMLGDDQPDLDGKGRPNAFSVRVFDSPTGEGEKEETIRVGDWDQLEVWRNQLAERVIAEEDFRTFASRLGRMIMPPYAHGLFRSSLARLRQDDRLRIRLRLPPELAIWPWEFAIVQLSEGEPIVFDHLAMNEKVSVVRHVEIAVPAMPFEASDKRRVLVAMASPKPYTRFRELKLDKEQKQIKDALQNVAGVEAVYIPDYDLEKRSTGATEQQICQALRNPADLFHFSGHGEFILEQGPLFRTAQGKGAIILAKPDGSGEVVSAERLCSLLVAGHVRAVLLDACETAMGDVFHKWSSVATSLLKSGIPAVLAMQFTVYDDLGRAFAAAFYQALVAGDPVDEAVSQGRLAMWRHREGDRDWGAPVLFLRNSGGCIFPPVRDESARIQAEKASEQAATLNTTLIEWARQGAPASPTQLQFLQNADEKLPLTIPDVLLLLRSSLACRTETYPWASRFRQMGLEWVSKLDAQEWPANDRPLEEGIKVEPVGAGEKLLGLGDPAVSPPPPKIGAVTWSAVQHPDSLTRQTASLALLALGVDEVLRRLQNALVRGIENTGQRRQRRAELYGILAETDAETAKVVSKQLDNVQDRFAVWWWRASRVIRQNWVAILGWSIRGALGAALALASYRALLAIPDKGIGGNASIAFAIYSYWGFMLGLALTFGVIMAGPLLLQNPMRPEPNQQRRVALLAVLLGALAFGVANVVVALFNGAGWNASLETLPSALLVGAGLGLGLYGQPGAGWHLGVSGWLKRLAPAFALSALAQVPALCENVLASSKQWLGASIFTQSDWLVNGYSWVPALQRLFDRCDPLNLEVSVCCYQCVSTAGGTRIAGLFANCFEQWLTIVDAGIVSLVLTLGITAALHISRATLKRRWPALGGRPGSSVSQR